MRQRFHQPKLRFRQPGQHPLGHALVIDRVLDPVVARGTRAIAGNFQIDQQRLRRAPFPVDEADDALRTEAAQEYAVAVIGAVVVAHALKSTALTPERSPGGRSSDSGQRARTAMAVPARSPASRRCSPATAIMAALSVQNCTRG